MDTDFDEVSIEETLKLIQVTLEKVTQTGENVNKITTDISMLRWFWKKSYQANRYMQDRKCCTY